MNIGVILAGGSGIRFGANIPKQYQKVNNKEIISFVISAFKKSLLTDKIIVVSGINYLTKIEETYGVTAIEGGNNRNTTVYNAITYIKSFIPNASKIVFADSVRPMITPEYIDRVFGLLDSYDGVITVAKITDSLHLIGQGIVDREKYWLIQTPEAFRMQILSEFDPNSKATAIVNQFEKRNIYYCDELNNNFKITYPQDLKIVKALLGEDYD